MPVRRIDNQHGTISPRHATQEVVVHYHASIPKDTPHSPSSKLQSSIAHAKVGANEIKINFAHRTGITSIVNDDVEKHGAGLQADADLLASDAALKGKEVSCSEATVGKLKSCGSLSTTKAMHADLLAGEGDGSRERFRGHAVRPIQYHELPYGRECDYVIGSKESIYREEYCSTKAMQKLKTSGHAPPSPRLVSVTSPSSNLQQQLLAKGKGGGVLSGIPQSPRNNNNSSTAPNNSGRTAAHPEPATLGYNVYCGSSQQVGSEKAEKAVDAQTRREIELLTGSARSREHGAEAIRSQNEALLTPRSMRLETLRLSSMKGVSSATLGIPQPPSPRTGVKPLSPADMCNSNTSLVLGASNGHAPRSPRLQPIISRSLMDKEVPPSPNYLTNSPRSGRGPQISYVGTSTIPADVSPLAQN